MGEIVGRLIVLVVLVGAGVLLIWQARAAASGRLGRNQIAGIRTAITQSSDAAWLAAHRRAKGPTICAGVLSIASGLFAVLPVSSAVFGGVVIGAALLELALLVYGTVVGGRAARAAPPAPAD